MVIHSTARTKTNHRKCTEQGVTREDGKDHEIYRQKLTERGPTGAPSMRGSTPGGRRSDPKLVDLDRVLCRLNFMSSTPTLEERGMGRIPSEIYPKLKNHSQSMSNTLTKQLY